MANATLYTSLDAGAPQIGNVTDTHLNFVDSIYRIFVPVLVTGYGTKPGQGWELMDYVEGTGLTLKAPDGVFYVWCKQPHHNATVGSIWMAESLTAPFVYPPVGINVRSGKHSANYTANTNIAISSMHYSSYVIKSWALAVRGSQVIFTYNSDPVASTEWISTTTEGINSASRSSGLSFFGNLKPVDPATPLSGPQNSVYLGGFTNMASTHTGTNLSISTLMEPHYMRLRTLVGGTVERGDMSSCTFSLSRYTSDSSGKRDLDLYPEDLVLESNSFFEPGIGMTAKVPGILRARHYQTKKYVDFMLSIGRTGELSDMLDPVLVGDIQVHFLPISYGILPITLDERYW